MEDRSGVTKRATKAGEKFAIRHCWTDNVLFEAELSAKISREPDGIKLGAAVKLALEKGANLAGANLYRANLDGATGVINAGTPNGWKTVGYLQGGWLAIRVGCRNKRLAEGRKYWGAEHPFADERREVLPALDYIEAIARLRGWRVAVEAGQ